ncbi:MAG: DUF1592 domain-containing protein [Planctomycetota bacterium]
MNVNLWPKFSKLACVVLLVTAATSAVVTRAVEPTSFDAATRAFLQTYCARCHSAGKSEGGFRLDKLSHDFTDQDVAQRWGEVVFRINNGEMPPPKEPQPKAAELGGAVDAISTRVKEGEAARMARRGPVAHYRLSREEYGHTIYDLLGVYYDVTIPGALNDDPRWHGFDRIGSLLTLSPSHVDRYVRAAETAIARAFPTKPPEATANRRTADDGRWRELGLPGPKRWAIWPGHSQSLGQIQYAGLYRVRLRLSGLPSFRGRLPHLALWHQGMKRSIAGQDVSAAEDRPIDLAIEAFLPEGGYNVMNQSPGMLADGQTPPIVREAFVNTTISRETRPNGYKQFDDEGRLIFPLLIVDSIELEGPIASPSDVRKREGILPTALAPRQAGATGTTANRDPAGTAVTAASGTRARHPDTVDALMRFASRAWRRPITDAELERYVRLIERELAAAEVFDSAYRTALVAILSSKSFYYLEEGSADRRRDKVNDWELASRLSYFLWSSLPDEQLFAAAAAGKLHEPATLKAQLRRMLDDPKAERFVSSFPKQWLQLHRVGQFPADPELYPDYDKWLEQSMVLETVGYFDAVFRGNLSIREFLASDWTLLNPRLALHYGLPPMSEPGFRKVALPPESGRGGLLTHASVLSLTSDGTRHRPVHRGVWVSEAIFGRTPPPPPPNVEPLAPTPSDRPKATIRQQLEAHATHAICASCHAKIDPLGFAFDNFDAIGRWRTEELVSGGQGANPPVDPSGRLPDGREFRGAADFKKLLSQDLDRFAEAFAEQLATYALRRVMTIDDRPRLREIAAASKSGDYPLRTVIENLVLSDLFQQR